MSNADSVDLIERIRLRLAWWLIPGLDKEEAKNRLRLVEQGQNSVVARHEGYAQLVYLQKKLCIRHWEKPEPYAIDPDEFPTADYRTYLDEREENAR